MERYEIELHYALAAQRQVFRSDLYQSLRAAELSDPFEFRDWVRVCDYRYSHHPLSAYGSTIGSGGRFNYGDAIDSIDARPFPALYIAGNENVAYHEFLGASRTMKPELTMEDFALMRQSDHALIHFSGNIHHVIDTTRPARLRRFAKVLARFSVSRDVSDLARRAGIQPRSLVHNVNELVSVLRELNWRGWPRQHGLPAACQIFGKLSWEAGFEAILYRSTKASGDCVAIFPENLEKSESRIWLANPPPPGVITKQLDATNWKIATQP